MFFALSSRTLSEAEAEGIRFSPLLSPRHRTLATFSDTLSSDPGERPRMNPTETEQTPQAKDKSDQTETPLESLASICTVLAIFLFVTTFIFQNFEIPSGSMEKTLLIGDHVLVDRISFAPPTRPR